MTAAEPEPAVDIDWPVVTDAFRAGDAAAAEVAAAHLLPFVAKLVRQLTAWQFDRDDLVQDILVTTLARRHTFRGDAKLPTWLTRIAINACRAHHRKQWLRRRLLLGWSAAHPPANAPAAGDVASNDEQSRRVQSAIAQLPAKHREAVVLHYLQGLTTAEAAEALGASQAALKKRLARGRDQLREILGAHSPDL